MEEAFSAATNPLTESVGDTGGTASGQGAPATGDLCAMCDVIPDATAKAECKKSCAE